jgi:hypothetical protein
MHVFMHAPRCRAREENFNERGVSALLATGSASAAAGCSKKHVRPASCVRNCNNELLSPAKVEKPRWKGIGRKETRVLWQRTLNYRWRAVSMLHDASNDKLGKLQGGTLTA